MKCLVSLSPALALGLLFCACTGNSDPPGNGYGDEDDGSPGEADGLGGEGEGEPGGLACVPGEKACVGGGYKECDSRGAGFGAIINCTENLECREESRNVCQYLTCVACGGRYQPCCDADACSSPYQCQSGTCQCTPKCAGQCGGAADGCSGTCTASCGSGKVCRNQVCVTCGGVEQPCCANDRCMVEHQCKSGVCKQICLPQCQGKECGGDGCSGSCGTCRKGWACNELAKCKCVPQCQDKECGTDGCGGSCGVCTAPKTCGAGGEPGVCAGPCRPNCAGKCGGGTDGCGGTCTASCGSGKVCQNQLCVTCGGVEQPCCNGRRCTQGTCGGGGTPNLCGTRAGWYDAASNLTWKTGPAGNAMPWQAAINYCAGLGGGWRLPAIGELRSLIRGCAKTQTRGACGVTAGCLSSSCRNSACAGCGAGGGPDSGGYWPSQLAGASGYYWSSSRVAGSPSRAWYAGFGNAGVGDGAKTLHTSVRCVRSGL